MSKLKLFSLRNKQGFGVDIANIGATIVNFLVPDKYGKLRDIALGFENLKDYLSNPCYFGTTVAPVAGRLSNGELVVEGEEYKLPQNEQTNNLHSGGNCRYYLYDVEQPDAQTLLCRRIFPDGEDGFPGNIELEIAFQITDDNELIIDYAAKSDAPTVINPTNHMYLNLNGATFGSISGHEFGINSSEVLELNSTLAPTGRKFNVNHTPFDLRMPTKFSKTLKAQPSGIDHYFILETLDRSFMAAVAYAPESGIEMRLYTTELGIQFYTGNQFDGNLRGKGDRQHQPHDSFCMETQGYPDAPNHLHFPSIRLMPSETYRQKTMYKFEVR